MQFYPTLLPVATKLGTRFGGRAAQEDLPPVVDHAA